MIPSWLAPWVHSYLIGLLLMGIVVASSSAARRSRAIMWALIWPLPWGFYLLGISVAILRAFADWLNLSDENPVARTPQTWGSIGTHGVDTNDADAVMQEMRSRVTEEEDDLDLGPDFDQWDRSR